MRQIALISALASASAIGIAATAAELERGRLMRAPTHDGNGPAWFFGPGGKSQVFQPGETIPAGYEDHPSKVKGHDVGGGTQTAVAPSNGSTSAAAAAKTTREKAPGQTSPTVAAQSGVGGTGNSAAPNAPAKTDEASGANASTVELDAHGHAYDPTLHAATKSKTKDGLWRLKVGASRPAPAPGYPLDL